MRKKGEEMLEIRGKVNTAICYAKVVEDEAISFGNYGWRGVPYRIFTAVSLRLSSGNYQLLLGNCAFPHDTGNHMSRLFSEWKVAKKEAAIGKIRVFPRCRKIFAA